MKTTMVRFVCCGVVCWSLGARAQEPAVPPPLSLAVLDYSGSSAELAETGKEAALLTGVHLGNRPGVILVERAALADVLSEQELALSGTMDASTAARVGQLTGAMALVTGRVIAAGGTRHLAVKLISTETGRVFGQTVSFATPEELPGAAERLAAGLAAALEANTDAFRAKVEKPEERLERLRLQLVGKEELPKVHVAVAEEHLSRPVADPAVQTEIQLTLQSLGFPLVADAAAADWLVSGEAFSERAGRYGQLVSCRARIELKVQAKGDTEFKVDRTMETSVDVSENVAAKAALAKGGAVLAERILPHLLADRP
jgi:hypothetical protein